MSDDNQVQVALRNIQAHIREAGLRPGDQLPTIKELAQQWNLSPSTVRSALLKAETIGFVEIRPRAGAFVKEFDFAEAVSLFGFIFDMAVRQSEPRLLHLYEMRAWLEQHSFEHAARAATPEDLYEIGRALERYCQASSREEEIACDDTFHMTVAKVSGNPILAAVLDVILAMMRPDRELVKPTAEESANSVELHKMLFELLRRGDATAAAEAAASHSARLREALARLVDEMPREET